MICWACLLTSDLISMFFLADIAKAFLQIRLNRETDSNCISFCLVSDGEYKFFRYNSMIFKFVTSPFILN